MLIVCVMIFLVLGCVGCFFMIIGYLVVSVEVVLFLVVEKVSGKLDVLNIVIGLIVFCNK